jgi:FkbM family methyltransferase
MIKKLKKIVKILINYDEKKKSINPNDQLQFERCQPWFKANGDQTLRLNYDLNENSIVFDLGGYKGEFTSDIYRRYGSTIYVFEPILEFYNSIKSEFSNVSKIHAFHFGLGGKNESMKISLTDNSSSVFIESDQFELIQIKSIIDFIKEKNITKVDLIKINIEGGEYEVLESLLENNLITIFNNIQVQFHDFIIENAQERMNKIQMKLAKTHELTYQYEFVWENWKLK